MTAAASILLAFSLRAAPTDPPDAVAVIVSAGKKDANGFLVHEVRSPYQAGTTTLKVLAPDQLEQGQRYPVVFVLPVAAGQESRFGDGRKEVHQLDLHHQRKAVFVAPTFSHLPWYAVAALRQYGHTVG